MFDRTRSVAQNLNPERWLLATTCALGGALIGARALDGSAEGILGVSEDRRAAETLSECGQALLGMAQFDLSTVETGQELEFRVSKQQAPETCVDQEELEVIKQMYAGDNFTGLVGSMQVVEDKAGVRGLVFTSLRYEDAWQMPTPEQLVADAAEIRQAENFKEDLADVMGGVTGAAIGIGFASGVRALVGLTRKNN